MVMVYSTSGAMRDPVADTVLIWFGVLDLLPYVFFSNAGINRRMLRTIGITISRTRVALWLVHFMTIKRLH